MENIFSRSPEHYRDIHTSSVAKALNFERGENVKTVQVPQSGLEEHFESEWDDDESSYDKDIYLWRGTSESVKNLTKIDLGDTGDSAFIVDTSDLVIGKKSDEYMFYMICTCWAMIIDLDQDRRVAYHLPGITADKDVSVDELLKALAEVGKVEKVSIFYNSSQYDHFDPDQTRQEILGSVNRKISGRIPLNFYDMNKHMQRGSFDLFVRGDSAKQYYTQGFFNEDTDEAREERLHAGDWELK